MKAERAKRDQPAAICTQCRMVFMGSSRIGPTHACGKPFKRSGRIETRIKPMDWAACMDCGGFADQPYCETCRGFGWRAIL